MQFPIVKKLEGLGLDVEFLCWLEGKAARLPDIHETRKLTGAQFAAAIRAAAWLSQLWTQPEVIKPLAPEDWRSRYAVLEAFLSKALRWSMVDSFLKRDDDLAALEHVLETLIPESSWAPYQADILHLRQKGYPQSHKKFSGPSQPSGGKKESEQTQRMRAAVAYVESVSKTPYVDLANLWNECGRSAKTYQPDTILSRLRKGDPLDRTAAAAQRLLKHWKGIYDGGELWAAFPGPFPLSPELRETPAWYRRPSRAISAEPGA